MPVDPLPVILDAISAAVAYVDTSEVVRIANTAFERLCGRAPGQAVGLRVRDVLGPAGHDVMSAHVRRVLAGETVACDARLPLPDGAERWIHASCVPHRDGTGVIGFVAELHDITAQKQIEDRARDAMEKLQAADAHKDHFLALLGHELRNPLAPIVTALDLMAFRGAGFERERDVIRRQTEYMTRLVDDLLDISRVARGKIELRKEPIDICDAISKAVELTTAVCEQRSHQLTVDAPRGYIVDGDPVRLAQIFANLIGNAAKYTRPRGRIDVIASRSGNDIVVTVRDNGPGIPAELRPTIFEPFVQGPRGGDRAQGGLGLGLALVRSLAALHGGIVSLASDSSGSQFTVALPAAVAPSIVMPSGAASRLLVVDDNVDAASMIAELLRTIGYDVAVAHDASHALSLASEFRPAVALLDVSLPAIDGYELARNLKSELQHPPRLVAVTAYGQHQDIQRSRAAGFEVQLGKPVDFDQLVTVLGRLVPS